MVVTYGKGGSADECAEKQCSALKPSGDSWDTLPAPLLSLLRLCLCEWLGWNVAEGEGKQGQTGLHQGEAPLPSPSPWNDSGQ